MHDVAMSRALDQGFLPADVRLLPRRNEADLILGLRDAQGTRETHAVLLGIMSYILIRHFDYNMLNL